MKKSDLKAGMIVETMRGQLGMVFMHYDNNLRFVAVDGDFSNSMWGEFSQFDENLMQQGESMESSNYHINKIYTGSDNNLTMLDLNKKGELLWEREPEKTYELDGVEYSESTLRSLIKKATE